MVDLVINHAPGGQPHVYCALILIRATVYTKFQHLLRNQFDDEVIRAAATLDEAFQAALLKLIEWEGPILPSQ